MRLIFLKNKNNLMFFYSSFKGSNGSSLVNMSMFKLESLYWTLKWVETIQRDTYLICG